jgi:hypothetical protein
MNVQSNEPLYKRKPIAEVDTVQDLIDFLTKKVSKYPTLRNQEVFVLDGNNYHQLTEAVVIDDTFVFGIDRDLSEPFAHEDE